MKIKKVKKQRADSEEEPEAARESVAGSGFFNRKGWDLVQPRGAGGGNRDPLKFALRDGESAVVAFLEPEPTGCPTHSYKASPRPMDFRTIVCPEQNPKWLGKCPIMGRRGDHYPSHRLLISVLDMRTLWSRGEGDQPREYANDLSDFSYEPPPDSDDYDRLGEDFEPQGKGWKKLERKVKAFWMSQDTGAALLTFTRLLRKRCVNCNDTDQKSDRIRKDENGELTCKCGDPRPATLLDCFVKVTRRGADKSTTYLFEVSQHFGFGPRPDDKDGKPYRPIDYGTQIHVPSPEEVARLVPAAPHGE